MKIISENKKYRIVMDTTGNDTSLCNDFHVGNIRCRFKLGEAVAILEKKKSVFIFQSCWHRIEITNIANVVQEWMTKYFIGIKLWNG